MLFTEHFPNACRIYRGYTCIVIGLPRVIQITNHLLLRPIYLNYNYVCASSVTDTCQRSQTSLYERNITLIASIGF